MSFRFKHTDTATAPAAHDRAKGAVSYEDETEQSAAESTENDAAEKPSRRFQFAVDFAYTLNHAIVCTLTDPITDVPIGATVQNMMAKARDGGEKISGKEILDGLKPANIMGGLKETVSLKKNEGERFSPAASWLAGEVAGDFGAVPVVVALQHYAPSLMKGVGKLASPIAKPVFHRSAQRAAKAEFKLGGMEAKGAEFEARVDEIFQHEMDDLPKAIMWTGVSPAINIIMQKTVMGNQAPVTDLMLGKGIGAAVTSSLTLGLRASSPAKAQKWDHMVSEKAGKPVSNVLSKVLGVDKEELNAGVKKKMEEEKGYNWKERVANTFSSGPER